MFSGKARRLKQAKDEATEEIEKYRVEREKQFKDFEGKVRRSSSHGVIFIIKIFKLQHAGSKDQVAAKIDTDARTKLEEMNRALGSHKDPVMKQVLDFVYAIKPELHQNYVNLKK